MKYSSSARLYYLLLAILAWPLASRAQLVPVPLAARVQRATLIIEAQVGAATAERLPDGHLATRHALTVYKVFKGQLPAGLLSVLTPGGTLGLRREEVSNALALGSGQQGVLLLEPWGPASPGSYQATAGPQGFIAYDLAAGTAAEPFGSYPSLAALYPALGPQAAQVVQLNARLLAAQARRTAPTGQHLTTATPVISGFSPAAVTAGTSTFTASSSTGVLTITGAGFNATQGAGYVLFRNADTGGATTTRARSDDYLQWTDTQIRVRVPSASAAGNTAGTGPVQVVNSDGNQATSGSSLVVTYALSTADYEDHVYRTHLVGTGAADNPDGYVLHYTASTDPSLSVPAAARTAFETALATWRCQAGANRSMGADVNQSQPNDKDNTNLVSFGALPAGVLGQAYSTYSGCPTATSIDWSLVDTDYEFTSNPSVHWYFGSGTPGSGQYDFQSVALHELGHGLQLQHIISATSVMNYALANGATRRTLDNNTDLAAASDETTFSTSNSASERCSAATYVPATGGCPLPVELVAFAARYVGGQGTTLGWATASERQSAYFGVESQDDPTAPWQEVARLPAAGTSATTRQYRYLDARPLAGTRYYRLHQVDQDGTATYSASVVVQAGPATGGLQAYPNPASGLVHLRGPVAAGATAQVQLLDALGRVVAHASGPAALSLPLAGLPPGLYVLEWDGGTGTQRQRLTVDEKM